MLCSLIKYIILQEGVQIWQVDILTNMCEDLTQILNIRKFNNIILQVDIGGSVSRY